MPVRPFAYATLGLGLTLALIACGGPREVRENWHTGLPMREGKLTDGKQSGAWTYWFDNGQRQAAGSWENDKQVGEWSWWYANGQLKQRGQYAPGGKRIGQWQHWHDNGKPASVGSYDADRQHGLWRYRHASGVAYADGWFDHGVKSGVWRLWNDDGTAKETLAYFQGLKVGPSELIDPAAGLPDRDFGVPKAFVGTMTVGEGVRWTMARSSAAAAEGLAGDGIVIQKGNDGTTRSRSSFAGRTSSTAWYANGILAIAGGSSANRTEGTWRYWHDNGQLAAEVGWVDGRIASSKSWREDGSAWSDAVSGGAPAADVPTADDDAPVSTPESLIAALEKAYLLELPIAAGTSTAIADVPPKPVAPAVVATEDSDRATPFAAAAPVVRATRASTAASAPAAIIPTDARQLDGPMESTGPSLSPIQALPAFWTKVEEAKAGSVITRYSTGSAATESADEDYVIDPTVVAQRPELLGKTLPQTRFLSSDGEVIDLESYVGQKPVVLVVLRGFAGQVCIYCAAQTAALANRIDDIRKLGAEVVVVYPGPAESVPTFLQAVRTLRTDPPPVTVALDVSLLLVRALDIEDNLARPTSVVIDRSGKVRYVYVGKTIADRPSVDDLLHEVAKTVK
ncbi:MAG: redoxin family protein [Planctomycetes bacterium]|nr:redoxin family protein [Planctomycetota bacterium]